jgi:DNA helicase-2/ATP-dependent DNA helicase PcrA
MNNIFDQVTTESFAAQPRAERTWSDYQQAIFGGVENTSDNILVQAVAGSGKTTTLEEISQRISATLLCFNKPIADAAKARGINAKTLHSFGNSAWWRNTRSPRLDFEKLDTHLDRLFGAQGAKKYGYMAKRCVAAIKNSGMGLTGELQANEVRWAMDGWEFTSEIPEEDLDLVALQAQKLWKSSVEDTSTLDFDDMLYGPLYHGWNLRQRDTILVDESQDLNSIQHLMLMAMQTRVIAVGDRWQAIYAFRGALSDSMDRLKDHFQMIELPLSICYRCPQSVVVEAQKLCPHIEWRPGAPSGIVTSRSEEWERDFRTQHEDWDCLEMPQAEDPELFPHDMLVLCRNNAPLFGAVMRHVRAQKPCRVLSNALEGLSTFIKRFKTDDILALRAKLEQWLTKEIEKHSDAPWRVQAFQDKIATIFVLCEHFTRTDDLLRLLKTLAEGRSGPIFSTIHKAKGLEAREVYFLRPDLCPSPWARKANEREQERNLRYVAVTRAQEKLTFGISEF